jgi:hypothetical protein
MSVTLAARLTRHLEREDVTPTKNHGELLLVMIVVEDYKRL